MIGFFLIITPSTHWLKKKEEWGEQAEVGVYGVESKEVGGMGGKIVRERETIGGRIFKLGEWGGNVWEKSRKNSGCEENWEWEKKLWQE